MPNPEAIKRRLISLPILDAWERPSLQMRDRHTKVWEGNAQGGHFHFYRHDGWLVDPQNGDSIAAVGCTLSVTGSHKSKAALVADFTAVLGEPRVNLRERKREGMNSARLTRYRHRDMITYFTWLKPKDEQVENRFSHVIDDD